MGECQGLEIVVRLLLVREIIIPLSSVLDPVVVRGVRASSTDVRVVDGDTVQFSLLTARISLRHSRSEEVGGEERVVGLTVGTAEP